MSCILRDSNKNFANLRILAGVLQIWEVVIDCRLEISLVTVCLNLGFLLGLCVCLCKYIVFLFCVSVYIWCVSPLVCSPC